VSRDERGDARVEDFKDIFVIAKRLTDSGLDARENVSDPVSELVIAQPSRPLLRPKLRQQWAAALGRPDHNRAGGTVENHTGYLPRHKGIITPFPKKIQSVRGDPAAKHPAPIPPTSTAMSFAEKYGTNTVISGLIIPSSTRTPVAIATHQTANDSAATEPWGRPTRHSKRHRHIPHSTMTLFDSAPRCQTKPSSLRGTMRKSSFSSDAFYWPLPTLTPNIDVRINFP
jgi:hypothetical protein